MHNSTDNYMNLTLSVPKGSSNHGNPQLLCTPPAWYDLPLFFLSNYLAHAATVISSPGEHWLNTLYVATYALLLPMSGVARAFSAICYYARFKKDPIQKAARAGALCMVGRKVLGAGRQLAQDNREWWDANDRDYEDTWGPIDDARRSVNGSFTLNQEFCLLTVPPKAPVAALGTAGPGSEYALAPSLNSPKLIISLVQAFWAAFTLYRARGDQIEQYGYAAFGLTVAQYAFMSILNTLGNLAQPEYPFMSIIRTPLMDEAEKSGCSFEGDIKVQLGQGAAPSETTFLWKDQLLIHAICGALLGAAVVLGIMGGLSGCKPRNSTSLQRGFTMTWLVVSIAFAPVGRMMLVAGTQGGFKTDRIVAIMLTVIGFGAPAIGGMVVVGLMIQKFGVCVRLG